MFYSQCISRPSLDSHIYLSHLVYCFGRTISILANMPLPKCASNDGLHRFNCSKAFHKCPPKAWEFLFYIPNPLHPIEGDVDCSAHFCLVLPDAYKQGKYKSDPAYHAVALITRRPRSPSKSQGYMIFRPHTTSCTCPERPGELETHVVDREVEVSNYQYKKIESPCHLYNRTSKHNKGHFETWSWYDDSIIPVQAPKMVNIACLHLKRPLTQSRFGLVLDHRSMLMFDNVFEKYKEALNMNDNTQIIGQRRLPAEAFPPLQVWGQGASTGLLAAMSSGISA